MPQCGGKAMRNKVTAIVLAAMAFLMFSAPLSAHHGNAAYDNSLVTVKATVTDWVWANPHCWLRFDVTDDKGTVTHWVVETSNPSDMVDRGWSKEAIKPGDQVTVTMHTVKNGRPAGRVQGGGTQVVLPNGTVLKG
jgi:hypothetical protein